MNRFIVLLAVFFCASAAQADSLPAILARLDAFAPSFKGVDAGLKMVTHTAIIDDDTQETGQFKLQKRRANDVRAIIEFTSEKDKKTVAFAERTVKVYYPNLSLVQVYDLGKNIKLLDQYLLLGFGTSGKDLQNGYDIRVLGMETVEGKETTRLELTPKDKAAKERLVKAEIWLADDADYPLQQKFYQPNGNFTLVTYAHIKLNPVFGAEGLELKVPPHTREEHPK